MKKRLTISLLALVLLFLSLNTCSDLLGVDTGLILTPYDGQRVAGTVTIVVDPGEGFGGEVEFYIDDMDYYRFIDSEGPDWEYEWDTLAETNGFHTIFVNAKNFLTGEILTNRITVTVDNASGTGF